MRLANISRFLPEDIRRNFLTGELKVRVEKVTAKPKSIKNFTGSEPREIVEQLSELTTAEVTEADPRQIVTGTAFTMGRVRENFELDTAGALSPEEVDKLKSGGRIVYPWRAAIQRGWNAQEEILSHLESSDDAQEIVAILEATFDFMVVEFGVKRLQSFSGQFASESRSDVVLNRWHHELSLEQTLTLLINSNKKTIIDWMNSRVGGIRKNGEIASLVQSLAEQGTLGTIISELRPHAITAAIIEFMNEATFNAPGILRIQSSLTENLSQKLAADYIAQEIGGNHAQTELFTNLSESWEGTLPELINAVKGIS